jgi:two-component system, NarL family, sensor histidine kinase FusK
MPLAPASVAALVANTRLVGITWVLVSGSLLLGANGAISPVAWLVAGFMGGTLVRLGPERWPALAIGTLTAGLLFGSRTVGALVGTIATISGAWFLATCLRRRQVEPAMRTRRDVFGFLICVPIAALFPATGLLLGVELFVGAAAIAFDGSDWLRWWFSAMLGYLIGVPTIAGMTAGTWEQLRRNARVAVALALSAIGFVIMMMLMPYGLLSIGPAPIAIIIVLVSALRLGLVPTSLLAAVLTSSLAVRYVLMQPVIPMELAAARVWAFATVLIIVALMVHALLLERDNLDGQLRAIENDHRLSLLRATQLEQQRIGRDLHDVLGQELTSVSILASHLALRRPHTDAELHQDLQTLSAAAGRALDASRSIAHGLLPALNYPGELPDALTSMARRVSETTAVRVDTEITPIDPISVEEAENLFRIAQEALNNAIKHAATPRVLLRLTMTAQQIELAIEDSGTGFDLTAPRDRFGAGLSTMRYRSELARGTLHIERNANGGTTVRCELPRKKAPAAATPSATSDRLWSPALTRDE